MASIRAGDGMISQRTRKPVQLSDDSTGMRMITARKTLTFNAGSVNCVRWNPAKDLIASGSDDTFVVLWAPVTADLVSGEGWAPRHRYKGHTKGSALSHVLLLSGLTHMQADVLGVDWHPSGELLASCSIDNTIRIWSIASQGPDVLIRFCDVIVRLTSTDGLQTA